MNNLALRITNLRYSYPLHSDFFLDVPEWEIKAGDSIGIVGGNGSGKSTFLSLLAGVLKPDQGEIYTNSKVTPLLGVGVSVNDYQTGHENICTELQNHLGRPPTDFEIKISASFTELSEPVLNEPLHTYSSGMKARIAFAPLCAIQPGILVMDEVLAVGDNRFVPKALALVENLIAEGNALVLASHSSKTIRAHCSKAIWMKNGAIFMAGDTTIVMDRYDEWCREQALQMIVEEHGDLELSAGKQVVRIREDIHGPGLSTLCIELDPSAFSTKPVRADLKITTHEGYELFSDRFNFDTGSIESFTVELRQMGSVDLLVETVFSTAERQHLTLTSHPRPHGIHQPGGQPLFVPFLHVA